MGKCVREWKGDNKGYILKQVTAVGHLGPVFLANAGKEHFGIVPSEP